MNKQLSLPFAIYDTQDTELPTLQEIGDAFENCKPVPSQFIRNIYKALQTIKKHGYHRLIITILSEPPTGRRCIRSQLDDGYHIEHGRLYGTQCIDICPYADKCPGGITDARIVEDIFSRFKSNNGICIRELVLKERESNKKDDDT